MRGALGVADPHRRVDEEGLDHAEAGEIEHADGHTAERDIEILLRFWAERWGTEKGRKLAAILRNHRLMLRHAFGARALFLPVLWQDERPVGALAILVDVRKKSYLFFMATSSPMP